MGQKPCVGQRCQPAGIHRFAIGLLSMVLSASVAEKASAVDIFVDNIRGNDRNRGTTAGSRGEGDGPVRTIAAGLERLPYGGRLILLPTGQPYSEPIVLHGRRNNGFENDPLIIEGNGVELIGTRPIEPAEWEYVKSGVFRLRRPTTASGTLFLNGEPIPKGQRGEGPFPLPAPGTYVLSDGGYYYNFPDGAYPRDLEISESGFESGVFVYRSSHIVVRNLRLKGFQLDAAQVRGKAIQVRFQNCVFSDNGRAGVAAYTLAEVELENCFLERNAQAGVYAENGSDLYLKSCLITGSPEEIVQKGRSDVRTAGGEPEPLEEGPVVVPPGFRLPTPQPPRPEPTAPPRPAGESAPSQEPAPKKPADDEPAPKSKRSFFDYF